jgi:hypothetical protein
MGRTEGKASGKVIQLGRSKVPPCPPTLVDREAAQRLVRHGMSAFDPKRTSLLEADIILQKSYPKG